MPRLSIMVPVYKVEKYLNKCVDSILSQTFTDFELILVNDDSPDSSPEICEEYKLKDKRVIVIHKENGGLSDTRNAGLDIATGDYLGFVDSDDYIAPTMYETLIRVMENTKSDMVICDNYRESPEGIAVQSWLEEPGVFNRDEAMLLFLKDIFGSQAWNKLYKRELFGDIRYPVGHTFCQDISTTYKYVHRCKKVVYIKEPLYYYLIRESSASFNYTHPNRIYDIFLGFKERYEFAKTEYSQFVDDCLKLVVEHGLLVCYGDILSGNIKRFQQICEYLARQKKNIFKSRTVPGKRKMQTLLLILNSNLYYALIRCLQYVRKKRGAA